MKKYKYLKISIATTEILRSGSYGEVTENINYRKLKHEKNCLFCSGLNIELILSNKKNNL